MVWVIVDALVNALAVVALVIAIGSLRQWRKDRKAKEVVVVFETKGAQDEWAESR